jgi:hypothetical protein
MRLPIVLAACALLILPVPTEADDAAGNARGGAPVPAGPQRNRVVGEMLVTVIDFQGVDDPKTTLEEILDQLARRYNVCFDVNEKAFRAEGVKDVVRVEFAATKRIPAMRVPLGRVVQKILDRVQVPSGATFLVRRNRIEITTGRFVRKEVWGPGHPGPFLPLVHTCLEKRPLAEALRELEAHSERSIVVDASAEEKSKTLVTARFLNTPLDTALTLLTDMADLQMVQVHNTFYVTTPEKARKLEERLAVQRANARLEREALERLRESRNRERKPEPAVAPASGSAGEPKKPADE